MSAQSGAADNGRPAPPSRGTLYIVATPIGNLEDITLRALRVLKEVAMVAAEDTRVTRKLLSRYEIRTPLTSFHRHTRDTKVIGLVERLIGGDSVAVVTDAGTPGVSDPGCELVAAAVAAGVAVVPIPGPSAALSALVVSGLPTNRFAFEGFAPRGRSDRRAFFEALDRETRTLVLFEAPSRLGSTLASLHDTLGDRRIAVAREMTKLHEEVYRGTLSGAIGSLKARPARGEYTLVVAGRDAKEAAADAVPPASELDAALSKALNEGASVRDAARDIAGRLGVSRRIAYQAAMRLAGDAAPATPIAGAPHRTDPP